jgi:hypothetical protein
MIFDLALGGSATLDLGHRTLDKMQRVPSRLSPSPAASVGEGRGETMKNGDRALFDSP